MQGREAGHGGLWLAVCLQSRYNQGMKSPETGSKLMGSSEVMHKYLLSNVIYKLLTSVQYPGVRFSEQHSFYPRTVNDYGFATESKLSLLVRRI
jgi:hypothetical protein